VPADKRHRPMQKLSPVGSGLVIIGYFFIVFLLSIPGILDEAISFMIYLTYTKL